MRIFLKGALSLGVILIHQLGVLLFRPASHVRLVRIDLFLLKIFGARVLLDPFFFVIGDSEQDGLLFQSVEVNVIDV